MEPALILRGRLESRPGAGGSHEHARSAAAQSGSIPHASHAGAGQAIVLRETGATGDAVDALEGARRQAEPASPRVLRSWLAATHGETLAAHARRILATYFPEDTPRLG